MSKYHRFQIPPKGSTVKAELEKGHICDRTGHLGRAEIRGTFDGFEVYRYDTRQTYAFAAYWPAIRYFNRCVGRVAALHPPSPLAQDNAR